MSRLMAFVSTLSITLLIVSASLYYLRSITRRVLLDLCHSENGADFWLRTTQVMALSGATIAALMTAPTHELVNFIAELRSVLLWTLVAVFVTTAVIASMVWGQVGAANAAKAIEQAGPTNPTRAPITTQTA